MRIARIRTGIRPFVCTDRTRAQMTVRPVPVALAVSIALPHSNSAGWAGLHRTQPALAVAGSREDPLRNTTPTARQAPLLAHCSFSYPVAQKEARSAGLFWLSQMTPLQKHSVGHVLPRRARRQLGPALRVHRSIGLVREQDVAAPTRVLRQVQRQGPHAAPVDQTRSPPLIAVRLLSSPYSAS